MRHLYDERSALPVSMRYPYQREWRTVVSTVTGIFSAMRRPTSTELLDLVRTIVDRGPVAMIEVTDTAVQHVRAVVFVPGYEEDLVRAMHDFE